MFKKILVALDGSQLAEEVLPYAAGLARRFASRIHVATVITESERDLGLDRVFQAYLESVAAGLKARRIAAQPVLLSGDAPDEVLSYTEKNGIDLIALTTLGKSGAGRWRLGSVAGKVVSASSVPVLVVPPGRPVEPGSRQVFNKVLLPVDVSELGASALPCVEALTEGTKRSVVLLNVEPEPYTPTRLSKQYYAETAEALRRKAREYMEKTVKRLREKGIGAEYQLASGDPAEQILDQAAKNGVDLIAMSSHGRSGIARWALGSVASKVLQETPVPLLLVRAPGPGCPKPEGK